MTLFSRIVAETKGGEGLSSLGLVQETARVYYRINSTS